MTKHFPFYRRYPDDLLKACVGMTFEQRGAYSILIDLIYAHDDKLEDDPRYIAGVMGVSIRKWTALRSALITFGKVSPVDGFLRNKRASAEAIYRRRRADKNRANGAKVLAFRRPDG